MIESVRRFIVRSWWRLRVWWADGQVSITPKIAALDYRTFERACLLLGLDPDKVRSGTQDLDATEMSDIYETGEALIELVCRNDAFMLVVLRQADRPVAEEIVAHVMASFFLRSIATFSEQKRSYATMQSGVLSKAISKAKGDAQRRSDASSPRSAPPRMNGS